MTDGETAVAVEWHGVPVEYRMELQWNGMVFQWNIAWSCSGMAWCSSGISHGVAVEYGIELQWNKAKSCSRIWYAMAVE